MDPLEYLRELRESKKTENGFNSDIRAWVDENSGVARALHALAEKDSA
jgi:hypothetical protein